MAGALKVHTERWPATTSTNERADAFATLYRRNFPQLVALCRRNLGAQGDPEAVAQEAFVRAWVSLDRFSEERPFWPWVATIARRLCIDARRRLALELSNLHVEATVTRSTTLGPHDVVEADEELESARRALAQLKPSERRVIALREVNGWSYDQIARFEGVTTEAIRSSLKRARASLRHTYTTLARDPFETVDCQTAGSTATWQDAFPIADPDPAPL